VSIVIAVISGIEISHYLRQTVQRRPLCTRNFQRWAVI